MHSPSSAPASHPPQATTSSPPPPDAGAQVTHSTPPPAFLSLGDACLEYAWHGPHREGAPTLVFLHEALGCLAHWRDFPQRLAAATGLGALVYSRQGHGRSSPLTRPRPPTYLHDEALLVLPQLLKALGITQPILVGHSDGATIALLYAALPGSPAQALLLEAPHSFVEEEARRGIREAALRFHQGGLRRALERYHGENTVPVFQAWHDTWLDPFFSTWTIEAWLSAITCPTLVLQGLEDAYATVRQVEAVADRASGPVVCGLLPACGHTPHREQEEETLSHMVNFLQLQGFLPSRDHQP